MDLEKNERQFSSTVAQCIPKSLQFYVNAKLSEFKGCEATIDIILSFIALFDILDSGILCPRLPVVINVHYNVGNAVKKCVENIYRCKDSDLKMYVMDFHKLGTLVLNL